ncbi:MAG: endolytic transglycosylase MltG [Bacilli bacterium]|nr:endolytic transglycosylase MltG [Bacilli bacterium]
MKVIIKRLLFIIPVIFVVIFIGILILYKNSIKSVSSDDIPVEFIVEKGTTPNEVIPKLKEADLIKSEFYTKVYVKLNNIHAIHAGKYILNKNMDVKKIFDTIADTKNQIASIVKITFPEGKNMRDYAKIISNNTKITEEQIYSTLSDKEYIRSLVNTYWFLPEEVLDDRIYYPLEGYLAPNTYEFDEDVTIKDIFKVLLDQQDKVLSKYKDKINNSNFNLHQILTLASIAELEGNNLEDRKNIVGVFINRMNNNIPLGSDVTTYYAAKINMGERDLTQEEIIAENPYNTRPYSSAGSLPIGPICNITDETIEAVVDYIPNEYFYFVADKNGKLYFSKTEDEHTDIIDDLKEKGLWFEY